MQITSQRQYNDSQVHDFVLLSQSKPLEAVRPTVVKTKNTFMFIWSDNIMVMLWRLVCNIYVIFMLFL